MSIVTQGGDVSGPRAAVTRAIQEVNQHLQLDYVQAILSPQPSVSEPPVTQQRPVVSLGQTIPSTSLVYPYRPITRPPYNPRHGYGPLRPSRSRTSRHSPLQGSNQGRKFTKTVVLVATDDIVVPRGKRREELHKLGVIVNLVDFCNWDEQRMEAAIEEALRGVIDVQKPTPRYVIKSMSGMYTISYFFKFYLWVLLVLGLQSYIHVD